MRIFKKLPLTLAVLVVSSFLLAAGCASTENTGANTTSTQSSSTGLPTLNTASTVPSWGGLAIPAPDGAGPADIWLDDYESRPNVLTVETGTTVTWINYDNGKPLSLTSDDALFAVEMVHLREKEAWRNSSGRFFLKAPFLV